MPTKSIKRAGAKSSARSPVKAAPPAHVAIVGLGGTCEAYLSLVKRLGGRKPFFDQVWGINALGDALRCDLVFHMDDVRIQEIRARAKPEGNIAAMLAWLKTYRGPVMTSRKVKGYPGLVEFPLQDVLNATGWAYFNNTAAYAVAYAVYLDVKRISLFGIDFSYANSHDAEKGRACVEFWLGIAAQRGIAISIAQKSALMDMCVPKDLKTYGYDCVDIHWDGEIGSRTLTFTPRKDIPDASEIERRYDHSRPTVEKPTEK